MKYFFHVFISIKMFEHQIKSVFQKDFRKRVFYILYKFTTYTTPHLRACNFRSNESN